MRFTGSLSTVSFARRWLFNGRNRSQRLQRKRPTAKRYVGFGQAMCARKDFERVAVEIETDRAIRRVIHDHPDWPTEARKRVRDFARLLLNSDSLRPMPARA
jgi:hypothetical protein